jgi:hypothetical protein
LNAVPDSSQSPVDFTKYNHFVLTFHDSRFECVATEVEFEIRLTSGSPSRVRSSLDGDGIDASPSGECALERRTVCRCSVRREHDLDRQREQRPQSLDNLVARHCLA